MVLGTSGIEVNLDDRHYLVGGRTALCFGMAIERRELPSRESNVRTQLNPARKLSSQALRRFLLGFEVMSRQFSVKREREKKLEKM